MPPVARHCYEVRLYDIEWGSISAVKDATRAAALIPNLALRWDAGDVVFTEYSAAPYADVINFYWIFESRKMEKIIIGLEFYSGNLYGSDIQLKRRDFLFNGMIYSFTSPKSDAEYGFGRAADLDSAVRHWRRITLPLISTTANR